MPEPILGASTAADVARILDRNGIPNILFGYLALALVGKDMESTDIGFVVNDGQVEDVRRVLAREMGMEACSDSSCSELEVSRIEDIHSRLRYQPGLGPDDLKRVFAFDVEHPAAVLHFHILGTQDPHYALVSIHCQKDLLWWMDGPIQLQQPAQDDRVLSLTTDNRLPTTHGCSGPWTGLYPIKILTQVAFAEASIRLACRDYDHPSELLGCWLAFLIPLAPHDPQIRTRILPIFKEFWDFSQFRTTACETKDETYVNLIEKLRREPEGLPGIEERLPSRGRPAL
ncbi:hypothetical protein BJY04DRAFT_224241 [Aspergillus karnatakaensis]|uniref:uncharacterized protein n=1 Tax=Aspergillus karnatakaensis TaxID=1810916 RepID=UPI003CCD56F4